MLNKKLMVLTFILVSLLAVSAVNATNNATSDVVSVEETSDEVVMLDYNNVDDSIMVSNEDVIDMQLIENDNLGLFEPNILEDNSDGTFEDLYVEISQANGEFNLTRNYLFNSTLDNSYSIWISKKIIINGNGFSINGNNEAAAFYCEADDIVLNNISFVNCTTYYAKGGAIYWEGNNGLLVNCNFVNCRALAISDGGGAVYWKGSNGYLGNCSFINCTSYAIYAGGAIRWLGANATINYCNFVNCSFLPSGTIDDGGVVYINADDGILSNCDFIDCWSAAGGNLMYYGAIIHLSGSRGVLDNCAIINCSSNKTPTANYGGIVFLNSVNSTVSNCRIKNCLKNDKLKAAFSCSGNNCTIYDCIFSNNKCTSLYLSGHENNLFNCTFKDNDYCSVICNSYNSILSDCHFVNNTRSINFMAKNCSAQKCIFINCSYDESNQYAGAIYWKGDNGYLTNCCFINCSSIGTNCMGGAIYWHGQNGTLNHCNFSNCSSFRGGAVLWNAINGTLSDCKFISCFAYDYCYTDYGSSYAFCEGGAIYWGNSNGVVRDCNFINCYAYAFAKTTTTIVNAHSYGGSIYWMGVNGTLINCNFINSSSTSIQQISAPIIDLSYGGSIYWRGDNGTILKSNFTNSSSSSNGTDIYFYGDGCNVYECAFNGIKSIYSSDMYTRCKFNPELSIEVKNITTKDSMVISPVFLTDTIGNITVFVDGYFYKSLIPHGSLTLKNLKCGEHNITLFYDGDYYYKNINKTYYFQVSKSNLTVNLTAYNNELITINVAFNESCGGNISLNIDNFNQSKKIINGCTSFIVNQTIKPGTYICSLNYSGDDYFNSFNSNCSIFIPFKESTINISANDVFINESSLIEYDISKNAEGILSIYLNNIFMKNITVNDKIKFENLSFGKYIIKIIYAGNDFFAPCENSTTFEVHKLDPTFVMSVNNITTTDYRYFETNIVAGNDANIQFIFNEDATGEINVTHEFGLDHDANYTLKLVNGKANLPISNVMGGSHYFTISYDGNDKYQPFYAESNLVFNYKPSYISYTIPDNLLWGDTFVIDPILPENATGEIEITVYNNGYYFNDFMNVNDTYNFTIFNGGKNYLELYYCGDEYYGNYTYIQAFNVEKLNTTYNITGNIEAGDYSTIYVTLNEDTTGNIRVLLNNNWYSSTLINGSYVFTVPSLKAGIYDVTINYGGDSKYNSFTKVETLNVTLKKTTLTLDLNNIVSGKNILIKPKISDGATGYINIYVDDKFKQKIEVGSGYTLTNPGVGKHEVKVVYESDGYFQSCENTSSFWVFSKYPIDAQDTYVIYNSGSYFKAKFYNENGIILNNKYVVFAVNGKDYARLTDDNGWATLDLDLDIGTYNITSINTIYNENTTKKLVVYTSIESQNLIRAYNSGTDFNATFLDDKAKALSNTYVVFKVNGSDYTVKTDMKGKAILNMPLAVGAYEIISINTLTNENKTNMLIIVPSIQSEDMLRAYNSSIDYKATFTGDNGAYLNNTVVTFEIGKNIYNVITDDEGVAILNIPLAVGQYNITAINPSTGEKSTKKLTIVPRIVNNTNIELATDCEDYYWICVVDDDGGFCGENEVVMFTFDNKTYSAKTDNYGFARLLISYPNRGVYPITTTYKGYSTTNNITVFENLESIIIINVTDISYNEKVLINISVLPEYGNGNVSIDIFSDENDYFVEFNQSASELFTKEFSGLNAGYYVVAVVYNDLENHYFSQDSMLFEVSKINPNIIIIAQDIEFGENATITVNIPQVSGNVTVTLNDTSIYNDYLLKDGVIVKTISNLPVGEYDVNVTFDGNDNYNEFSKVTTFTVQKAQSSFVIYADDINYGENITVNVFADMDGKATITLENVSKTVDLVANQSVDVIFSSLDAGDWDVNAIFIPNDSNYDQEEDWDIFTIYKLKSKITVAAQDIEVGNATDIVVTINDTITGVLKIELNNKNYTESILNGKVIFNINDIKAGNYTVKAIYEGDINYEGNIAFDSFEVRKIENSISIELPQNISNDNNISFNLPSDATGTVTLTVNNTDYTFEVVNGEVNITLPELANGDYNYTITYSGDEKYSSFTNNGAMSVSKPVTPEIIIPPLDEPNDDGNVIINLPSDATGIVTLTINNTDYVFDVVNGVANVKLPELTNGDYNYTITYSGDSKYSSFTNNGSLAIKKIIPTKITAPAVTTIYNSSGYLVATLKDSNNNALVGVEMFITLNDDKTQLFTDENGQVSLSLDGLEPKLYVAVITFEGNANYEKSTISTKVTVNKADSQIIMSDLSGIVGHELTITAKVISNNLNINGGIVTFYDGETEIGEANVNNGVATLTYTPTPAGEHTITAMYYGTNYENNISSALLNVSKAEVSLTIGNIETVYFTNPSNFAVNVLFNYKGISEGTIKYYVNGNYIGMSDVFDGKAATSFTTDATGSFDLFVVYNETDNYLSKNASATFYVDKIPTEITASGFNTVYNGDKYIIATLKDSAGNLLKYVKVTVTFSNGKTDTQTTNKYGQVQFSTNGLAPVQKYSAKIIFNGNDKYEKSTTTVKVKVYKATPKITAKAQKFKRSDKKKLYTIRLLTNQNIKMKYTKVYIKVNGKLYAAQTNKKGYATFKLTKLTNKGKYKAKIMYGGNSYYNALAIKVKLTVK